MNVLAQQWGESIRSANQAQGPQWLDELRLRALDQLTAHGLPHRKDEDWKYTPLRVLEKLNPAIETITAGVAADVAAVVPNDAEFPAALLDDPDFEASFVFRSIKLLFGFEIGVG